MEPVGEAKWVYLANLFWVRHGADRLSLKQQNNETRGPPPRIEGQTKDKGRMAVKLVAPTREQKFQLHRVPLSLRCVTTSASEP
jgi:hypothetical protein